MVAALHGGGRIAEQRVAWVKSRYPRSCPYRSNRAPTCSSGSGNAAHRTENMADLGTAPWHDLFAPEAGEFYGELGIQEPAGYFASRSAPMGAVDSDVVIATFYNFHPRMVRQAIPAAWKSAEPSAILDARLRAADAALRRLLGDAIGSSEMVRAAELARSAAQRATE